MTEETKLDLLKKLISSKEVSKELRLRKKPFINHSVSRKDIEKQTELLADGWEIEKEFKTIIRFRKGKRHDVLFEDKVWTLFASLGFNLLNKDRKFEIPYEKSNPKLTQQIDVFARDDETVLIVECKSTKEKNKKGDFKKDLEAYKTQIKGIRNSINALFPDRKLKFKFILATENYAISELDLARLDNIGGVHFDDEIIDYYLNMYKQIGLASRYQLLGSLFFGQEVPEMENKIPAIKGKMGGHTYFSFSIEPEKLLKIGYVLHRNKANVNMMPTYQRIIKRYRLNSVQRFIDEENGYFPNSIVISIDSGNKRSLRFDQANTKVKSTISDVGILHLPKKYRSAFIIDGQHRLYGYANSQYKSKNSIPVVAFLNLERSEQVKLFMQINENQKAVSKNLRNTLNSDLLWTSESYTEQQTALRSRIAITLGENRNSALFDKISIGEDNKIITSQAFDNALRKSSFLGKVTKNKIEVLGTFYKGDLDQSFDKLSSFLLLTFNYLKDCLIEIWEEPENIVVINKGIYGFTMLQSNIVEHLIQIRVIKDSDNPKKIFEETKTYLDPAINFIQDIDEETRELLRKAYGAPGDTKYWRTLQLKVSETHNNFKPSGLDDYLRKEAKEFNTKTFESIGEIETFFKKDFKERLMQEFGNNWLKKGVPPQTLKKAHDLAFEKNLKIENEEDEVEDWDCLTIIAYRAIALKNWRTLFENDYSKQDKNKSRGGNKEDKTKWMVELERIRNKAVHSYYVTEEEFYFVEELHDWLINKRN